MFVWLASYPKSGNTWIRLLLNSLHLNGGPVNINALPLPIMQAAARGLLDNALGIASSDLTAAELDIMRPRAFALESGEAKTLLFRKVHDAWRHTLDGQELFPRNLTRAVIYVVRDPRDVAVSYSHHYEISIDTAIARMADEEFALALEKTKLSQQLPQVLQSWSSHVKSWMDQSKLFPLTLRFEDMLTNPVLCCREICAQIGWQLDEHVIESAVDQTGFQRLADQEKKSGFSEGEGPGRIFFRQGRSGKWREILTLSQVQLIENKHGEVMARLGYL